MKNPVEYAKNLVKKQGQGYALAIAENTVQLMELAASQGGAPFAEEVEVQEQTYVDKETKQQKTRTIITINEAAKNKRLAKTLNFWRNVAAYLKARQFTNKAS